MPISDWIIAYYDYHFGLIVIYLLLSEETSRSDMPRGMKNIILKSISFWYGH